LILIKKKKKKTLLDMSIFQLCLVVVRYISLKVGTVWI